MGTQFSQLSIPSYRIVGVIAMRFSLRRSRLGAVSDKLLKVGGDLVNVGLQSPRRRTVGEQPSADLALDLVDCQGSVDLPWRIGVQMLSLIHI